MVEAKAGPRSRHTTKEIQSIVEHLKQVPDYRARIGTYPLGHCWPFTSWRALRAPRGSKDLAKFARKLSQPQRRALGIRLRQGRYPAPSQPTFWRLLEEIDGAQLQQVLLQVQEQLRGPAPQKRVDRPGRQRAQTWRRFKALPHCRLRAQPVLLGQRDGRHQDQRDSRGAKTLSGPGLEGPICLLGCLHTQTQTARDIVLEGGGDLLLTVKDNQLKLHQNLSRNLLPAPQADFPPLEADAHAVSHLSQYEKGRNVSRSIRTRRSARSRFVFLWQRRRPAYCAKHEDD